MADGRQEFIDYREQAPKSAHRDMYVDRERESMFGATAIGVPGELMGFWVAHQRFGALPWKSLVSTVRHLSSHDLLSLLGVFFWWKV